MMMRSIIKFATLTVMVLASAPALAQQPEGARVSSFTLPVSPYLSDAAQNILRQRASMAPVPPPASIQERRAANDAIEAVMFAKAQELYPVKIEAGTIGGVPVRTLTPRAGVSQRNERRVLINLFGGGFFNGAKFGGLLESAPVASLGNYRVVTVSYRLSPETHFPAARDDVIAVYKALLRSYRSEDIGIFGCSSGGSLAAQAVARMIVEGIPTPRAIGILCSGLLGMGGDSATIVPAITGRAPPNVGPSSKSASLPEKEDPNYFRGVRPKDPAAWPGYDVELLKHFPPTFLMAASRGFEFSQTVQSHNLLMKAGVPAELNIWDGFEHAFYVDPAFPESRDVHARIVEFFDRRFETTGAQRR